MQEKNSTQVVFSLKLRSLLDSRAMTQDQLAAAVGVSQGGVNKWLKGAVPGSLELLRIAKCFGCSMESLLTDQPAQDEAAGVVAWKIRAMTAEQKLSALKSGVVALVKKY